MVSNKVPATSHCLNDGIHKAKKELGRTTADDKKVTMTVGHGKMQKSQTWQNETNYDNIKLKDS